MASPLEGMSMVRRFTDELEGITELERNTQVAQADLDREVEAINKARLKKLYDDTDETTS